MFNWQLFSRVTSDSAWFHIYVNFSELSEQDVSVASLTGCHFQFFVVMGYCCLVFVVIVAIIMQEQLSCVELHLVLIIQLIVTDCISYHPIVVLSVSK